jgi:hypothetical protein
MSKIFVYTSSTSSSIEVRNGTDRVQQLIRGCGYFDRVEVVFVDLQSAEERNKVNILI